MSTDDVLKHKEKAISGHDIFLESLLPTGSYTKLYSYTHLLNGFAINATSEEAIDILYNAPGVRVIHEDIKMVKMTTHTPEYLGITDGVWPELGGAERSGDGIVIGLIDTGINPSHPSFVNHRSRVFSNFTKFKGKCESGNDFFPDACNGKIVGAQYFARTAMAAGDFSSTDDSASPLDTDGHGSHTASTAAGNYRVVVLSNGYNFGYASGMAPGAQISVYKAIYTFGGYMSDVVAAVDKAVEDGVDILSLSIGPTTVPSGPATFLNILEIELLFATKAGVMVVQAVGNGGPSSSSVFSFSPWITSVAASSTDREYNNSLVLGTGQKLFGTGLSSPTPGEQLFPIAAAVDVCTNSARIQNCRSSEHFISSLVKGKLIICAYTSFDDVADTIREIGAAGFILVTDHDLGKNPGGSTLTFSVPGILLNTREASEVLWDYYNSHTVRRVDGGIITFGATCRILEGRQAIYTGRGPIVSLYSSRGPSVNNDDLMQAADVLKPNIMAPGSSIWAAWTPISNTEESFVGQDFAIQSGTSMATPHVAGVAALIKQKHPTWSPAAIASAMMTTADITDPTGRPLLARQANGFATATPFDLGSGSINPTRALNPGLVFEAEFMEYVRFLCAVPGVDEESVRRSVGVDCPSDGFNRCSDLNAPSVVVASLVGSRKVVRRVTSVGGARERYEVSVKEPAGVGVKVRPRIFTIRPNASRSLKVFLKAREVKNSFEFGDVVLTGNRQHVVRIPMAVFVNSTSKL